jgi:aryl-alcohol dehydrogenase-like predicted oxidoreductase
MMNTENRLLGRTNLQISVLGLGAGGNSRLGLATGRDEVHAADVVRAALDLGITMIDTARGYQTERAIGQALKGWRRSQVVVSSKSFYLDDKEKLLTAQAFRENLETSLRELGLETIDIYFIHGLALKYYDACCERFLPVLEAARQAGKIRFIGITEAFESDTGHGMLQQAILDDHWDVMMVGFNLLNPSARERVLTFTRQKGIGVLGMFAVRRALIDDTWLRKILQKLAENGEVDPTLLREPDLMESLGLRGSCESLSEAAYRFCAYEPGMDCVLSGTSSSDHLKANLEAVQRGPLPQSALAHLRSIFGKIDSISGQVKENSIQG